MLNTYHTHQIIVHNIAHRETYVLLCSNQFVKCRDSVWADKRVIGHRVQSWTRAALGTSRWGLELVCGISWSRDLEATLLRTG